MLLETKSVFKQQYLQMFGPKKTQTIMNIFYPLEVVGRGSETQLQVGEDINNLI